MLGTTSKRLEMLPCSLNSCSFFSLCLLLGGRRRGKRREEEGRVVRLILHSSSAIEHRLSSDREKKEKGKGKGKRGGGTKERKKKKRRRRRRRHLPKKEKFFSFSFLPLLSPRSSFSFNREQMPGQRRRKKQEQVNPSLPKNQNTC